MVFSSIPAYLDPSNWQQQHNHDQQVIGSTSTNPLLAPAPPPPLPHGGGGAGSIRPGSMSERARLANIPMPETALKCPRCESTNTKFCYFNNYSLSQPRHFCKTCRRYWTRGGALRSVPVGGGCRRNKRSKSTSSKSPASSDRQNTPNTPNSASMMSTSGGATAALLGLTPQLPPLRFMSPLSQLTDNFTGNHMGLSYSGITGQVVGTSDHQMNFHGAANLFSGGGGGGIEPWRLQQVQQFPFFGGDLDPPPQPDNYQFHGGELGYVGGESSSHNQAMRPKFSSSSSMITQTPPVKTEENPDLNLSRQLLGGLLQGNQEQWNGNNAASWTELSSFSSSSTSNPL